MSLLETFLCVTGASFLGCYIFNHIYPQNPVYITNAYAANKKDALDWLNGINPEGEVEVEQDWLD